jgi:hypothetical protein
MRIITICFLLLLISGSLVGQDSNVYDNKGKLMIDTTYVIAIDRLEDFRIIEEYAFPSIYNLIDYPRLASENGILGHVIVKIKLESNNIINFSIVKSDHSDLNKSVNFAINKSIREFQYLTKDMKMPFEFYIPIKFEIIKDTFKKDMVKNNAITIKASSETLEKEFIKE